MKKIYEDIKKIFDSKFLKKFLYAIGSVVLALSIFSAGIYVGFYKASFDRDWGENYGRNFGMMPSRFMQGRENFPNAHGAVGKIIKMELPNIIVEDKNNTEKVVSITDDTKIEKMMQDIKDSDLQVDDFVVVIGNPNSAGQVEAKFIRVMPAPEMMPNAPINNNQSPQ